MDLTLFTAIRHLVILILHERSAKGHGMGDAGNRRLGVADTGNNDGAKIEDAPEYALVDLEALDLLQLEFDGAAAYEGELCDHPLVGEGKFSGDIPYGRGQPKEQAKPPKPE